MIWPTIPPDIAPWVYYLCVGASVVIVGVSKAGFGGGVGIVAIPVMALVMPAQHMLGVMLPVLIAADILSNLHYIKEQEWKYLRPLLAGAVGGVVLGSLSFWLLRESDPERFQRWLSILIGAICLLFVGMQVYGMMGRTIPTLPPRPASSVGVGALAGFVSTLSHSAGPIVTLYLLQEKLAKRRLVGTLLFYFLLINLSKVPTFVLLGSINRHTLSDSIWFIPLLPLGTLLGARLNRWISEKIFMAVMYSVAAVTAVYMICKSL